MSRDCRDDPGPGVGFLTFFVIGLLAYALTASHELWPRLQAVVQDTDPGAVTREHAPPQKAATVEWDELLTGNGLNLTIPDNQRPNHSKETKR